MFYPEGIPKGGRPVAKRWILAGTVLAVGIFMLSPPARPHCDTLEGPVVTAAKEALEKGEITPVLQWVKKEHEGEVGQAFQKNLAVRGKGGEARELADRFFFETLVRLHRAGEGAPYTGLTAEPVEPIIAETDRALEKGSVDELVKHMTEAVAAGIRQRFQKTLERKKHRAEAVASGREFVESYVEFTHYVERLHLDAMGGSHGEAHGKAGAEKAHGH
ncbi:MAG: hypothetical protein HY697_01975 [Deltaproteobacteria bacterium]|nr:hypothetical protein [Deltaproteobacteria bacterium]